MQPKLEEIQGLQNINDARALVARLHIDGEACCSVAGSQQDPITPTQ